MPRHRFALVLVAVTSVVACTAAVLALLAHYDVIGRASSTGALRGSGRAAAQVRTVAPFTHVELAGSNIVVVRAGAPQSVRVRADDNLLDRVTTLVRRGRLVIGDRGGSVTSVTPMRVEVTVPRLDGLVLRGSGIVSATQVAGDRLALSLPGSGVLRVSGRVGRLDVAIAGSGDAELAGLTARDASATVAGSGRILLRVTHRLDALVSGSGSIVYLGRPGVVSPRVTGSGSVSPG